MLQNGSFHGYTVGLIFVKPRSLKVDLTLSKEGMIQPGWENPYMIQSCRNTTNMNCFRDELTISNLLSIYFRYVML